VTVRRTHHGNLDAHVAQSGDAICPVSFNCGTPFEIETKFGEELNGGIDVFHHDADVVHTHDCHDVSLASNAEFSGFPADWLEISHSCPMASPAPRLFPLKSKIKTIYDK
jgi:hypothetical protein